MLNQSHVHPLARPHWGEPLSGAGAAGALFSGRPELVATDFAYGRDEFVFGEGEPAEYVYQVTSAPCAAIAC